MARHKDMAWKLPDGRPDGSGSSTHEWVSIHAAILMDIRDELKALNTTLMCSRFLMIPTHLERIEKNTRKKRRGAKKKAAKR